MYQFTEAEFAALEAAGNGTLVSGTAEYQATIEAIAATSRRIFLSVVVVTIGVFVTQDSELHAEQQPRERQFDYEIDEISVQSERPFLLLGSLMQKGHPRWDEFRQPIEKFPSAIDCLSSPQVEAMDWNLLDVNWNLMKSNRDVEVCLFRIFDTINDPMQSALWLQMQGYRVLEPQKKQGGGLFGVPAELVPVLSVEAYINTKLFEERVKFTKFDLPWVTKARGYQVQISFSISGRVVDSFSSRQGR